jgi:hypothetical protein
MDRSTRFLEARLGAGHDAELTLAGWSMAPSLRDGDRLQVQPFGERERPSPGQIVVARRGARLVTHRLVTLRDGLAVTRGDGCQRDDPPLAEGALLGRVVEVRRGARRFPPPPRAAGFRRLVDRFRGNLWR